MKITVNINSQLAKNKLASYSCRHISTFAGAGFVYNESYITLVSCLKPWLLKLTCDFSWQLPNHGPTLSQQFVIFNP